MGSVTKTQLHEQMVGKECTDGWDVLVSYSEWQLNELLEREWRGRPLFAEVSFRKHVLRNVQQYRLRFSPPKLSFKTTSPLPQAVLEIPVEGRTWLEGEDEADAVIIPAGHYRFDVTVPIVGIRGESNNLVMEASNQRLHFREDRGSTYRISLYLGNRDSNWQTIGTNEGADILDSIVEDIKSHFCQLRNLESIIFTLVEVSNRGPLNGDTTTWDRDLLKPQSFVFNAQPGVLSIFIQTKGERGNERNPEFVCHQRGLSPIPNGYSASIVISHRIFRDHYLIPNIKRLCLGLDAEDPIRAKAVTSGIALEMRYSGERVITIPDAWYYGGSYSHSNPSFSLHESPLTLEIVDDPTDLSPCYTWSWDWKGKFKTSHTPHFTKWPQIVEWETEIAATVKKTKRDLTKIQGDGVHMSLEFSDSNQPGITGVEALSQKPEIKLNAFKLGLPHLDIFRTQNILAPGRRIMKLNDVMLPCDLVLLGDTLLLDPSP